MKISSVQKLIFLLFAWVAFSLISIGCLANPQPKVWNLSDENLLFVGRKEHLEAIHDFFKRDDRRVLALTGGPGFGKTQIAKKYAQTFVDDYDLIWWFDSQQDLLSQFEKLAVALNTLLPENEQIIASKMSKDVLVDTIKNILRLQSIKYLFIFDNAEDYARMEKFIPYAHQKLRKNILLTSRNPNIWIDKIEIGKFKRDETFHLIRSAIPQETKKNMTELADTLDDYPLGLTIALGFIKSHPTATIKRYIAMHMKRTLKKEEKVPSTLLDHYPKNALAALEISLRYIEEESKDSLEALFFMSLLNSKDIPEAYISSWLKNVKSDLTADEAIKHIYDQSLIGVSETTEFNVNKKPEEEEKVHYLSIHDLIHQLINERIPTAEKKDLIEKSATILLDVFSGFSEDFVTKVTKEPIHLLHAQKLCKNAKEIGYSSSQLLKLKICLSQCLLGAFRDFETAKTLIEDIDIDIKRGLEIEPYYSGLLKISKGFLASINTHYDEAIQYMNEGLSIFDSRQEYQGESLRAISNLIQYYAMRGESDIAEGLMKKGHKIFQKTKSLVPCCFYLYVCSIILNDLGKFKETDEILEKLENYPELTEEYPTIEHSALIQKAISSMKQGRLKEARAILQDCEAKVKAFFHTRKNMSVSNILLYKNLTNVYENESSAGVIKELYASLDMYKDFFQGDKKQRNQARVYFALGKAYELKNKFKEALKAYQQSHEIYNNILKNKKIDDVSELYTELAILGVKLKDEGLTQKYLNAHIDVFGLDHPRTEKILRHLDQPDFIAFNLLN